MAQRRASRLHRLGLGAELGRHESGGARGHAALGGGDAHHHGDRRTGSGARPHRTIYRSATKRCADHSRDIAFSYGRICRLDDGWAQIRSGRTSDCPRVYDAIVGRSRRVAVPERNDIVPTTDRHRARTARPPAHVRSERIRLAGHQRIAWKRVDSVGRGLLVDQHRLHPGPSLDGHAISARALADLSCCRRALASRADI